MIKRIVRPTLVALAVAVTIGPVYAPQLLAFPHHTTIAGHAVYSEQPLSPKLAAVVAEADRRVAASPSGTWRASNQPIFLTDGGWRWTWLSNAMRGGFAVSRAANDAIVVNRSDADKDMTYNGAPIAGERSLSGVIAHEMTHGSIRARFGLTADLRYPRELREGYCDYVAGESSLSDAQAKALIARGESAPALPYWQGRKKVEAAMAQAGMNVDRLFATWGSH